MTDKVFFKTFNVDLASTLYTIGIPIDGIYPTERIGKVEFYFEDNSKLRQAIDDYHMHRLKIDPTILLTNRKEIMWKIKNDTNTQKSS